MRSFFRLEWGVQILYIFNQNQTPRSDSVNFVPLQPILCPQILEPSVMPRSRRPQDTLRMCAPLAGGLLVMSAGTAVLMFWYCHMRRVADCPAPTMVTWSGTSMLPLTAYLQPNNCTRGVILITLELIIINRTPRNGERPVFSVTVSRMH